MIVRKSWFAVALLGIGASIITPRLSLGDDVVARYMGTGQGNVGGHVHTMLQARTMSGGSISIPIANEDPKKGTPTPEASIMNSLKSLKPGTVVKLSVERDPKEGLTLKSVDEYQAQPGEDTPNGFIFSKSVDKTSGKTTTTYIVLSKYGQETTFQVPSHKGENGIEPDPEVMAEVGKVQEGTTVWVEHKGNQLLAIEPYTEPQTGKLLKLGETEINGDKVRSADVDQDGKTITLLVPGKKNGKAWISDSVVLSELQKQHPNTMVQFRTHADGDKVWLREISAAPKSAPPAPMPKEDTKKPAKAK